MKYSLPTRASFCVLLLAATAGATAAAPSLLGQPAVALAADQFLHVDQAFEIQPLEYKDGQLRVGWRIAPGYYLYRPRLTFKVMSGGVQIDAPVLPSGKLYQDEILGEVEVYEAPRLQALLPVKGTLPGTLTIKVGYQGCAVAGLCYPPQERLLEWGRQP